MSTSDSSGVKELDAVEVEKDKAYSQLVDRRTIYLKLYPNRTIFSYD